MTIAAPDWLAFRGIVVSIQESDLLTLLIDVSGT
jgi:hypothetical protein